MSLKDLYAILRETASRRDVEASMGRARIYDHLRRLGEPGPRRLLALGDAADIDVLSRAASRAYKSESAARLTSHFRQRAADTDLSLTKFRGPLAEPLRKIALLSVANCFAEYVSRAEHAKMLGELAEAAERMAALDTATPEARTWWRDRAGGYRKRAGKVREEEGAHKPRPECRSFCESGIDRHLREATRAADLGTREKVARGSDAAVLDWYFKALFRFVVAMECLAEPTTSQANALAASEVVVRCITEMLCRSH
jgi:hypothetical protein